MNDKKTISKNLIWRLAERFGAQGVTIIVSIVLARLLDPEVYGTVSIITIIITLLQVFLDGGFSTALIQKKEADDLDFSSVFYFNIVFGFLLYLILFFLAPFVAGFYGMPELTSAIRVLGVTLIIFSLKSVQQAYVSKKMLFKKFFWATLGGTIGAAIIGIVLAYYGYGFWALVWQYLFNMVVDTLILWIIVDWHPKRMFSFSRLKILLSFGWKMFASNLLNTFYNDIRQLIIGKMYTSSDLAFYNQGQKYTQVVVANINSSIDSVLLPAMSGVQDDIFQVKKITRRAIQLSTYIIVPIMVGISVCAEPIVKLIFTEKWLPCVPYLRIFCFSYALYPIDTANLNAIKALGRSDVFLRLEIIKKTVGVIALLLTVWYGPLVMAYSLLFTSIISQFINAWPNRKLLNYSYMEQLKDILPQTILSCLMGFCVYLISFLDIPCYITLIVQVLLGVFLYFIGSKIFHIDSFEYVLDLIKLYFQDKRRKNE